MRSGGRGDAWTDRSLIRPLAGFGAPLRGYAGGYVGSYVGGFGHSAEVHGRMGLSAVAQLQAAISFSERIMRLSPGQNEADRGARLDVLVRLASASETVRGHRDGGASDVWMNAQKNSAELALRGAMAAMGRLKRSLEN